MTSEVPIYEQLKQRVIEGIAKKELEEGEELPSVRQLAVDLGVNMHTVAKAYTQLKDLGFVSVHRSRGVVINPESAYAANEVYITALADNLRTYALEAICRGIKAGEWLSICNDAFEGIHKKRSF